MKRLVAIVLAVTLIAVGLGVGLAANPAGLGSGLELDRNAIDDPAVTGADWNTLYFGDVTMKGFSFVADGTGVSTFTGGGSKDIYDIPQWHWIDGSVPAKDDITNAYAAAYNNAAGDLIIYFGADRYANNGDSQIGFWFFHNAVGAVTGGTFSGNHTVGDVLVLSDFTQGGTVPTVSVYEWVASGGNVTANLSLIATGADCVNPAPGTSNDNVCGTVNNGTAVAPWPYTPKSGTSGFFPTGSFYEGGINLTKLMPTVGDCFSSFLAETRSSQSVSAVLKDFALGTFNLCPPAEISGYKFHDQNYNGLWDKATEPALGNWTINLVGVDKFNVPVNLTTKTADSTGYYEFANLKPGNYTVTEVLKTDWYRSYPATGNYTITLNYGGNSTNNNFGNYQKATKSGYKFEDLNYNGVWDKATELGLSGWTINLKGTDGMGVGVNVNKTTGADGNYTFSVKPGNYTVSEVLKANWYQSYPASGNYTIVLESGDNEQNNDFGNYQSADMAVTKLGNITYTVTVTNNGPGVAFNVQVDDILPGGNLNWAIKAPIPAGFSITNNHLVGVIASMDPNTSVDVTVWAAIPSVHIEGACLGNTATVTSDIPDPDTTNNSGYADIGSLLP